MRRRMRRLRRVLSLVAICLFLSRYTVSAKNTNINFRNITIQNGLSQNSVSSIYQDSEGYMWFGTADGLNRYDGYNFEIFKFNPKNKNSISGSYIGDIQEDSLGNIWVATSKGLSKISKNNNDIKNYVYDKNNKSGISHYNIRCILIDSKNRVWIGTEHGLNLYDEKTDEFIKYYSKENDRNSLSDNFILSMDEDEKGNIWIGTKHGLNMLNQESNTFKRYIKSEKNSINNNYIYDICSTKDGNLWIATRGGGLNKLNILKDEFTYYEHNENMRNSNQIASNNIQYLNYYNGKLFIGTDSGLSQYDIKSNKFKTFNHQVSDPQSIINNNILSIFHDNTGLVWVGTYDGISVFNPESNFIHYKSNLMSENTFSDNSIMGMYEDNEGILWFGTVSSGLNKFNRKTGEIKCYKYDSQNENSISNNEIWHIASNNDNEIWISTSDGLNKFDKRTEKFTRYYKEDGLSSNETRYIYFDKENNMWVGSRNGITVIDKNGNFKIESEIFKEGGLTDEFITSIYEDKNGDYWIGAALNGGVLRYNRQTGEVKNYVNNPNDENSLSMNSVKTIKGDSLGNIWIGTNCGLNKFNLKTENFTVYTESEGLSNNFVYNILLDEEENPWVSTNNGISKLDVKNNKFEKFNLADGLQSSEFNGYSAFKSSKGEMFFGGINGINAFSPSKIKQSEHDFPVVIKDVTFNEHSIYNHKNIELKYDKNHFDIEFFVPDYKCTPKSEYKYILEGFDKELVYIENRNHANYTNIPPGKYTFKVIARNSAGTWSNPTKLQIKIMNPPWESPLAYCIYAIILTVIIYFAWNYVKILEKMVKQRTKELNKKLDENEELYNRLIKMERHKNNYFINLSHELRTPLNIISSTLQLINRLTVNKQKIEDEKMLYYTDVMNKNSNRLLKLINNIIDTSKIDSGNYRINIEEVDIVYLVEEVSLSMKNFIENKGIEFIIDPQIEEKIIECDISDIERCIVNLLGNATKFTEKGGLIEVKIFDEGENVKISVKDTGIGIDKSYHKSIFNRFYQTYDKSSEEYGGSGLGLTLTMQLVKLHHGSIELESEVGKGSEFIITLPIKQQ